jgi:phosphotransferase system IIA component
MGKHIHVHVGTADTAEFESKHPRGEGGRFGTSAKKSGRAIKDHPLFSKADYEALKEKGYSDDEIMAIWDRDSKRSGGTAEPNARKDIEVGKQMAVYSRRMGRTAVHGPKK